MEAQVWRGARAAMSKQEGRAPVLAAAVMVVGPALFVLYGYGKDKKIFSGGG
jgi:hypothetical protein